jgi:cupin superfamily acireductone dioxygenase involved in methionine salvage
MAIVTIPAEARQIKETTEIKHFLADYSIEYDIWPLEDRVNPAAPAEDILAAYKPEIDVPQGARRICYSRRHRCLP